MKALMLSFCLTPYILISQVVWTNYNTLNSDLTYNVVFAINESIYDEIIVGTQFGLNKLINNNWSNYDWMTSSIDVRSITPFKDTLLLGTFNSGVTLINDFLSNPIQIFNSSNSGLIANQVTDIEVISNSAFAFATTEGLTIADDFFDSSSWVTYNLQNQLSSNNISCLDFNSQTNTLAIGTINGGLVYMIADTFQIYDYQNSNLPDNSISDLKFDTNNNLWITTPSGGLLKHTSSGVFVLYNTTTGLMPSNSLNCLDIDSLENIWIGTQNAGLIKFNGFTHTSYTTQNSPIPNNDINSIFIDKQQIIWIGTNDGLTKFNANAINVYEENIYKHIKFINNNTIKITSNQVNDISIFDLFGRLVFKKNVQKNEIIPLQNIKNGLCFISLNNYVLGVDKVLLLSDI